MPCALASYYFRGVAERSKATVCKSVCASTRQFKSDRRVQLYSLVAQMVEQSAVNRCVTRSIRVWGAMFWSRSSVAEQSLDKR
jgi:hypothetical protein